MLRIGLLGAGRIGITHAKAIAGITVAAITAVYDPLANARDQVIAMTGARSAGVDEILADTAVDAVIVATPTDLHAAQIEAAARAKKAIFCEKPIDLEVSRVRRCLSVVADEGVPLMVGFNRRFDPSFAEMRRRILSGAIGAVEMVRIVSADPAPPSLDYIRRSGGLFRDMMIHDFDMAAVLMDDPVVSVSATGSVLVDRAIGEEGDVDTATATLVTEGGRIAVITNSRRSTYGYDQRIEVHGSHGMITADNQRATSLTEWGEAGMRSDPALHFFIERYADAYRAELEAFVAGVTSGTPLNPSGQDGLNALILAEAATHSAAKGVRVTVNLERV